MANKANLIKKSFDLSYLDKLKTNVEPYLAQISEFLKKYNLNDKNSMGIGALTGGLLGLGSQYLTEEGRDKSFGQKLTSGLLGAGLGAAAGGLGSHAYANKDKYIGYAKDSYDYLKNKFNKEKSTDSITTKEASVEDWIAASPIGDIKPLNTKHGAGVGAGIGALAGGTVGLGAQYLTAEGRRRSFRKKLLKALIPTAAGAGVGAGAGAVASSTLKNRAMMDLKSPNIVDLSYIDPAAKKELLDVSNDFLNNENIRGIIGTSKGMLSPADLEMKKQLADVAAKYNPTPYEKAKGFLDNLFGQ